MTTESQLKAALVQALPEKLKSPRVIYTPAPTDGNPTWLDSGHWVTPHEWLAVVGMVEERLQDGPFENYVKTLKELYLDKSHEFSSDGSIVATWEERAQALADIGAITIKEES